RITAKAGRHAAGPASTGRRSTTGRPSTTGSQSAARGATTVIVSVTMPGPWRRGHDAHDSCELGSARWTIGDGRKDSPEPRYRMLGMDWSPRLAWVRQRESRRARPEGPLLRLRSPTGTNFAGAGVRPSVPCALVRQP